jgi:hypothetical protein
VIIPLVVLAIVIYPLFFNFVILPLSFGNEALPYPLYRYLQLTELNLMQKDKNTVKFIVILPLVILCNCDFTHVRVVPVQNRRRVVRTFRPFIFTFFLFLITNSDFH